MCLWLARYGRKKDCDTATIIGLCLSACWVPLSQRQRPADRGASAFLQCQRPRRVQPICLPSLHSPGSHSTAHHWFLSPSPAPTAPCSPSTVASWRSSSLSLMENLPEMWLLVYPEFHQSHWSNGLLLCNNGASPPKLPESMYTHR